MDSTEIDNEILLLQENDDELINQIMFDVENPGAPGFGKEFDPILILIFLKLNMRCCRFYFSSIKQF